MPEVLDEGGVVGVCVFLAMVVSFAACDAGVDQRQGVKDRDVAARCFLQCIGGGVDLREGARRAFDSANDGFHMRVPLRCGKDGVGMLGESLLQSRIGRGGNDGVQIRTRRDSGKVKSRVLICRQSQKVRNLRIPRQACHLFQVALGCDPVGRERCPGIGGNEEIVAVW
jgi:hypothetical protein